MDVETLNLVDKNSKKNEDRLLREYILKRKEFYENYHRKHNITSEYPEALISDTTRKRIQFYFFYGFLVLWILTFCWMVSKTSHNEIDEDDIDFEETYSHTEL